MKKIKKVLCILIATLLLVSCVGCMRMDYGIEIRENGTASLTAKISIEETAYEMLRSLENGGFEAETDLDTDTNTDTDTEAVTSDDSLDFNEFIKESIDDKIYYSFTETKEYSSYDKLIEDMMSTDDTEGMQLFEKVELTNDGNGNFNFELKSAVMSSDSEDTDDSTSGSMDDMGLTLSDNWLVLTMTIKMPGEITETTGEKIDNQTVKFVLNDFMESHTYSIKSVVKDETASTTDNDSNAASDGGNNVDMKTIIYIVAAVVVLGAGAFTAYLAVKNKKKNN